MTMPSFKKFVRNHILRKRSFMVFKKNVYCCFTQLFRFNTIFGSVGIHYIKWTVNNLIVKKLDRNVR